MQLTRGEADALFRELLIGVTSFFRDSEIFDEVQKQVIPQLFAGKAAGSVIRVWVPAVPPARKPIPSPCCFGNAWKN
jgi:two-component system CheB/CheR fusion protein